MREQKFNRIEKVTLECGDRLVTSYFLTGDISELEVDLASNFWFNAFREEKIKERTLVKEVNTLSDVIDFLVCKGIRYCQAEKRFATGIIEMGLLVGGELDQVVTKELDLMWTYDWGWEK